MDKKRVSPYLFLGLGLVGASYLSRRENRDKARGVVHSVKGKAIDLWRKQGVSAIDELIEKAGNPDPHDLSDTRMVGEGALYSVDYYNEEVQQK